MTARLLRVHAERTQDSTEDRDGDRLSWNDDVKRYLPAAMASLLCTGCATLPEYFLDPKGAPHPACGPETHVAAVGRSKDGPVDAEKAARAALIRQIRSRIEVEARRVAKTTQDNGALSSTRKLEQVVTEKADFRHGELLETVGKPGEHDGEHFVLVCMDRAKASDVLTQDMQEALTSFEEAHKRARHALSEGNLAGFSIAYDEAEQLIPPLVSGFAEIRAIDGEGGMAERKFQEAWKDLVSSAARIRAEVTVRLLVTSDDLPPDHARSTGDAFRQALTGLGLTTYMADSAACTQNAGSYLLRVNGSEGCRWTSLGHFCKPQFALEAIHCAAGGGRDRVVFKTELAHDELKGNHARNKDIALKRALAKLNDKMLVDEMRAVFKGELPLE